MSRVKGKNTNPELIVRKFLSSSGFKYYRLNVSRLPGKPDIVFGPLRKVIFVHGCFWHLHSCKTYRIPKTRKFFWTKKLASNVSRDKRNCGQLRKRGWEILILWECQLRPSKIEKTLNRTVKYLLSIEMAP
jgi:DNA mismatch endonuclease, patch repair protein